MSSPKLTAMPPIYLCADIQTGKDAPAELIDKNDYVKACDLFEKARAEYLKLFQEQERRIGALNRQLRGENRAAVSLPVVSMEDVASGKF